jgi:hypothetical protein
VKDIGSLSPTFGFKRQLMPSSGTAVAIDTLLAAGKESGDGEFASMSGIASRQALEYATRLTVRYYESCVDSFPMDSSANSISNAIGRKKHF